jgi:hypothetical protein
MIERVIDHDNVLEVATMIQRFLLAALLFIIGSVAQAQWVQSFARL